MPEDLHALLLASDEAVPSGFIVRMPALDRGTEAPDCAHHLFFDFMLGRPALLVSREA